MQQKATRINNNEIESLRAQIHKLEQAELERQRIEAERLQEKDIAQQYLDIAAVAILVIGADERVSLINKMGCKILGYPPEEIIGENWFEKFLPPDIVENTRQIFKQLINGKTQGLDYVENSILTKAGEIRFIAWHNTILKDSSGKITGTLSSGEDITSRKQAEEFMRINEAQLRRLTENMTDLIAETDDKGVFHYVSPSFKTVLNIEPDQLIGKGITETNLIHPEDLEAIFSEGAQIIQDTDFISSQSPLWRKECRLRHSDGRYVWIELAIRFLLDGDKQVTGHVTVGRDISERKQIEKILRESEGRYRNIFETTGVSIWEEDFSEVKKSIDELSQQGVRDFRSYFDQHPEFLEQAAQQIKIVNVNEATLSLFGAKTKAELLGSLNKIFVPETLKILREELLALAEGRTYFEGETINQTLEGEQLNVLLTMTYPGEPEKFDTVLVSLMDITDRKKAEQEIATQKARFQQLFENTPIGVAMLDNQDRIQGTNKAFENIFQYREDEIIGMQINAIVVPDELTKEAISLSAATLEGASVQKETIRKRKDGSLIPVHAYGVPIILDGKTVGVYAMYVDIADRQQKEQKLEYLSTHDALTGLYNRSFFEIEMERLEREKIYPCSIIVADVDGLKLINDHFGHATGDRLLKNSANLMKKAFRTNDVVARIGGDEFAILLPGADPISADQALERVKTILNSHNQGNPEIPISISFGCSTGQRGKPLLQVFKESDRRMYEEKAIKQSRKQKTNSPIAEIYQSTTPEPTPDFSKHD